MEPVRAFDEIVDFIASVPKTDEILSFRPSSSSQKRVESLLFKKSEKSLSAEEASELDRFLMMEHVMVMLKKKAKSSLKK